MTLARQAADATPPLPDLGIAVSDVLRVGRHHPRDLGAVVWWFLTGRRLRARNRLIKAIAALPFAYERWLADCAALDAPLALRNPQGQDRIGVHMHVDAITDSSTLAAAFASVLNQSWRHWRLVITTQDGVDAGEIPADPRILVLPGPHASRMAGVVAALAYLDADYLVPLDAAIRLPRDALALYAEVAGGGGEGQAPILYGDQDEIDEEGRRACPWFKPDWNADMFLAQDYLSVACALPVAATRLAAESLIGQKLDHTVSDSAAVYALLLQLAVLSGHAVRHVHRVTASAPVGYWRGNARARIAALRTVVTPTLGATVREGAFGTATIVWPLPESPPMVSIVVPTRDRLDLLRPCVEGVLEHTRYPAFEIVIADNGSVEPETLKFLADIVADPRVKVVPWPHPYNYSAINNFAVATTRGAFVCLLNNDIEIIDGEWLSELMRQACRPSVGAVGARLLYPDLSIQHAGVSVGMGNAAGHAHRGLPDGKPGYFAHALVARSSVAVTAACLVVSRSLFDLVGGLDESDLRIAYNDVDFCMKLHAEGFRNIYEPNAVLIHHESKSRGQDMAPEHRERYLKELKVLQRRWGTATFRDPMHHPMLDRASETYRPFR